MKRDIQIYSWYMSGLVGLVFLAMNGIVALLGFKDPVVPEPVIALVGIVFLGLSGYTYVEFFIINNEPNTEGEEQ